MDFKRIVQKTAKVFVAFLLMFLLVGTIVAIVQGIYESKTSFFQSKFFADQTAGFTWEIIDKPSPMVVYPDTLGPFNMRRGYSLIPGLVEKLTTQGYAVVRQPLWNDSLMQYANEGYYIPYIDKEQAGLQVYDRYKHVLFTAKYPIHAYKTFDEIPPLVVSTILAIEDKKLLSDKPYYNPAIDAPRFALAVWNQILKKLGLPNKSGGASTIATQLMKYRYSPGGLTTDGQEKLRQMYSASVLSYMKGRNNLPMRQEILRQYLNSSPLGAVRGYGEVNGIGAGLFAWYGADFDRANFLLRKKESEMTGQEIAEAGIAYRQILSLLIAHRRPAQYLNATSADLRDLSNTYLMILQEEGVIGERLFRAATEADVQLTRKKLSGSEREIELNKRKSINLIRTPLLSLLNISSAYDLDRLDLTVETELDSVAQVVVTEFLKTLNNPEVVDSLGLRGDRMLRPGDDPSKLIYSFTLYERAGHRNLTRVQADSWSAPLNINEGTKLDLGSTAKLRTMISYLMIVEQCRDSILRLSPEARKSFKPDPDDAITTWANNYIRQGRDTTLSVMIEAALDRSFSANPGASFFTAGGLHTFHNFNRDYDGEIMPIRKAFRHSVNLPFVRLMREMVEYYIARIPNVGTIKDANSPSRDIYLKRFIRHEGNTFLKRFYGQFKGLDRQQLLDEVFSDIRLSPYRFATIYHTVTGEKDSVEIERLLGKFHLEGRRSEIFADIDQIIERKFNLQDLGYLASMHPLKLWLANYLIKNPGASLSEVYAASDVVLPDVYKWLTKKTRASAQNRRIRVMLEQEAFTHIHELWVKQGYPFDELVPSYATSLGVSADRPAALAVLAGIISAEGMKYPTVRINKLSFGTGTPYETVLERKEEPGVRVFSKEIATSIQSLLYDVVENGTAVRLKGQFLDSTGTPIRVGGKTGTGDHRYKVFGAGRGLIKEIKMNRTATFMFILGENWYGTISVAVPGRAAENYIFTSTLPVMILKEVIKRIELVDTKETRRPTPKAAPDDVVQVDQKQIMVTDTVIKDTTTVR